MKTYFFWLAVVLIVMVGCRKTGNPFKPEPRPEPDIATAKATVAGSIVFSARAASPDIDVPPAPKPGDKCPVCNGSGQVGDGRVFAPCGSCKGTGKVLAPGESPPTITVPPIEAIPEPPRHDAPPVIDDKLQAELLGTAKELVEKSFLPFDNLVQLTAKPALPPQESTGDGAQAPAKPATLFELIVASGRPRRVILFTDSKYCTVCRNGTKPELVALLTTYQWILGPSTAAHVEIIDIAVEKRIVRYNDASPADVAAALGFDLDSRPLYVLIDNGKVVRHSKYDGPETAKNMLLKG